MTLHSLPTNQAGAHSECRVCGTMLDATDRDCHYCAAVKEMKQLRTSLRAVEQMAQRGVLRTGRSARPDIAEFAAKAQKPWLQDA